MVVKTTTLFTYIEDLQSILIGCQIIGTKGKTVINVNVCSRCIAKRADGLSRASEAMWTSALEHVIAERLGTIDEQDGITTIYNRDNPEQILMCNEAGFDIEDTLLETVILKRFKTHRAISPD